MPRGGARPGAGCPKGFKHKRTIEREEARNYLSAQVRAEIEPLTRAMLESAKGLLCLYAKQAGQWVRVTDPKTIETLLNTANKINGEDYYLLSAKDPDTKALKDIFDREFGKPTEHHELSGPAGEPLVIQWKS